MGFAQKMITRFTNLQRPSGFAGRVAFQNPGARRVLRNPGNGFFRRRPSFGLSEEMTFEGLSENVGFWGGLGTLLGAAGTKLIDAKAQAEVLKAQAQLYTPQNIETARRQAEFQTAQAGGMSTGAMIGLGLAGVALAALILKNR